jgi:RNA polymerase sigma factor (sigma-70 family)
MRNVIETLRRVAARQGPDATTDAVLLERFIVDRDEGAFEGLVRRHGPMVLGVCRRILRHTQDAEDAFQATFLVLVRKASSIAPRELVGNWLYGVAHQTARKALATGLRRSNREQGVETLPERAVLPAEPMGDVMAMLDRELAGLPATYRAAIVLCDLEGHSGREAARLLGWPEGTLFTRLTRGRKLLADRLGRRGVATVPVVAFPTLTPTLVTSTVQAASATVLGPAAAATVVSPAVATLTEGVLQAMIPLKLKFTVALVVVASLLGVAVGAGGRFALGPAPGSPPPATVEQAQAEEPPAQKEPDRARQAAIDAMVERYIAGWKLKVDDQDTAEKIRRLYLDLDGTLPPREALRWWLNAQPDPQAQLQAERDQLEAQRALLRAKEEELIQRVRSRSITQTREALQRAAQEKLIDELLKSLDEKTAAELFRALERRQAIAALVDSIDRAATKTRDVRGKQGEVEFLDAIIKAVQERKEKAQKEPAPKKP